MENTNIDEDRFLFLSEAEILLQKKKYSNALEIAQTRLKILPLDLDARVVAANALVGLGKVEEITNIIQEAEIILADFSLLYHRLGDVYRENGFYREAVSCYKKYIALNPDAQKTKEAIEHIVRLEREDPLLTEAEETDDEVNGGPEFQTITLADLYIRQGHFSMAAEILQKIIQNEPDNKLARAKLDTVNTAITLQASTKNNSPQTDILLETMTSWLENINRLKK